MSTFDDLIEVSTRFGAGFLPLMDPDRLGKQDAVRTAVLFEENGADALLIGGSFLLSVEADRMVRSAFTEDFSEAVAAFQEKRKPSFKGR